MFVRNDIIIFNDTIWYKISTKYSNRFALILLNRGHFLVQI